MHWVSVFNEVRIVFEYSLCSLAVIYLYIPLKLHSIFYRSAIHKDACNMQKEIEYRNEKCMYIVDGTYKYFPLFLYDSRLHIEMSTERTVPDFLLITSTHCLVLETHIVSLQTFISPQVYAAASRCEHMLFVNAKTYKEHSTQSWQHAFEMKMSIQYREKGLLSCVPWLVYSVIYYRGITFPNFIT